MAAPLETKGACKQQSQTVLALLPNCGAAGDNRCVQAA
jgi:hypothetical protein